MEAFFRPFPLPLSVITFSYRTESGFALKIENLQSSSSKHPKFTNYDYYFVFILRKAVPGFVVYFISFSQHETEKEDQRNFLSYIVL